MSNCQNCQFKTAVPNRVENYEKSRFNPNNFDEEKSTYTIGGGYYAPPWPAQRTTFDMNLQTKFNTAGIPDFLNYRDAGAPKSGEDSAKPTRKSVFTGRYDAYSY